MLMPMPGVQLEEIWKALYTGYAKNSLRQMLRMRLNVDLDDIVPDGSMKDMTFELLDVAGREGWEVDLIRESYRFNSGNADLMRVYQKYGLASQADVQQGGNALIKSQPVTDAGFEITVKQSLPFLDVMQFRNRLLAMEGRVCRVELNDGTARMGTGFLVGPDTMLTNFHVMRPIIEEPTKAAGVRLRFDYKVLRDGSESPGTLAELHAANWRVDDSPFSPAEAAGHPAEPLPTAEQLDYAVVRLKTPLGDLPINPKAAESPKRGWIRVPDAPLPLAPHQPLLILQHPKRQPLKLALDTDAITGLNANQTRVKYATNTEPGSSGSPCFDLSWNLVALHHYGDEGYDQPPYNQGVPIGLIRERLARNNRADALGGDSP
jgi:hypothetical protein